MGCSSSKSTTVADKSAVKAASAATSNPASEAAPAVPTGSKTAIVLNFSYTYNEGKKDECNAILTKVIDYNGQNDIFGSIAYSYWFKEHADGLGYDAQEVFANAASCEKYYRIIEACPFMEENMSLATMATQTKSEISISKEELPKAPTISQYYPTEANPEYGIGPSTYVMEAPDISKVKVQFGWVREPKTMIVMNFSFTYVEGKKDEASALNTRVIEYNREAKMFGGVAHSYWMKQHADGLGFDAKEVFIDAASCEKYYRNFEACPFMEECMTLATMLTTTKSEICITDEELAKAPTISQYYPTEANPEYGTGASTYVMGVPDISMEKVQFGWVREPKTIIVMNFSFTYVEGKKDEANDINTRVIEYNRESKIFGGVAHSYWMKEHADGLGFDAQEVFIDAASCEKYYRNFEACPFMEECMTLATMLTTTKSEICITDEELAKAPTISQYYPTEANPEYGTGASTYVMGVPDIRYQKVQFGWISS